MNTSTTDLTSFYKTCKIKADDQATLAEQHGITDVKTLLQAEAMSIYAKRLDGVSDRAQSMLRALLHYYEEGGHEAFDMSTFTTHLLLHAEKLESLGKQQRAPTVKKDPDEIFSLDAQGFDPSTVDDSDDIEDETTEQQGPPGGPEEVIWAGITYNKRNCYRYELPNGDLVVVGIRWFLEEKEGSPPRAICALIVPLSKTFLGQGKNDTFTLYGSQYCQIRHRGIGHQAERTLFLSELRSTATVQPKTMPKLCYQPQREGAKRNFAYFFDESHIHRVGLRTESPRVIELFCGSGGMHCGYKANGFETIKAIDKDEMALQTFRHNHPEAADAVECVCVNKYLRLYKRNGTVQLFHASSPCQGFSKANRNGGKNDSVNNELALTFTEGLRRTQALLGVFENVDGIWSQKGMPYLKRMLNELVEMNYQFRVMVLRACNYGDPQPRPRFIIFAARYFVHLPLPPVQTHADPHSAKVTGREKAPWVTTGDVLDIFSMVEPNRFPNMNDVRKPPSAAPGVDGVSEISRNRLSAAILASGPAVLHYELDREGNRKCLSVRDVAALQSYPNNYKFFGSLKQKYKQVGNSVPCGLASAIARAAAPVLRFVYREELEQSSSETENNAVIESDSGDSSVDEDLVPVDEAESGEGGANDTAAPLELGQNPDLSSSHEEKSAEEGATDKDEEMPDTSED